MPFALVRPSPPPPLSSCPSHEQAHAILQLPSGKSPMRQCPERIIRFVLRLVRSPPLEP